MMQAAAPNSQQGSREDPRHKRKAPVRRDPEKRRQQNCSAQKKYREKLKQRLEQLEKFAAHLTEGKTVAQTVTPEATPWSVTPSQQQVSPPDSSLDSSSNKSGQGRNGYSSDSSYNLADFDLNSPALVPPDTSVLWDPTIFADPALLMHSLEGPGSPEANMEFVECGCDRSHLKVTPLPGPREYHGLQEPHSAKTSVADPYSQGLRLECICIVQAMFANCSHISITPTMLCDENSVSPFYRPGNAGAPEAGSDAVVKSIQGIFRCLKPDLRPIKEQITIMHQPMIDILPFPTFRRNLIQCGNAIADEELFYDLMNGLICWGVSGAAKMDVASSTGHISTGSPWESRSWEARPWFIQKYWTLLGGDDGELVRQSEWWQHMTGGGTMPAPAPLPVINSISGSLPFV